MIVKFIILHMQLRVGQDSESDEEGPTNSSTKSTSRITPAPEQLQQRHSDPTPDTTPSIDCENGDKVLSAIPRTFPRQQVCSRFRYYVQI